MAGNFPSSILHPRRILVRGVNWLGDAVMATPALLRLRERFPHAQVALLTSQKLMDLWLHHPAVDEIVPFTERENVINVGLRLRMLSNGLFHGEMNARVEAGRTAYAEAAKEGGTLTEAMFKMAGEMRKEPSGGARFEKPPFDLALVLPNSPRSALELFLGRIPNRVGYARPWRNVFLNYVVPARAGAVNMRKRSVSEIKTLNTSPEAAPKFVQSAMAHQIHEYLHLVAALGAKAEPLAPQLFVSAQEIEAVQKKFGLQDLAVPVFGLNPGAEYGPAKRWPAERFAAAAQQIQKLTNCTWLIFGGKNDEAVAAQIQSAIGPSAINLAGKTTLRELMALLKFCRVLLTNDTGPMHVAAALGTSVVVPFGSTSPELTGPGLPGDARHSLIKSDVPCSPCFLRECPIDFRCMAGIGVEKVVAEVCRRTQN